MDVVPLNDVEFEVLRVMARYTGPKAKIARKFGENIFGNAENGYDTDSYDSKLLIVFIISLGTGAVNIISFFFIG